VVAALEWNPYTHFLRLYRFLVPPAAGLLTATGVATVLATPALCVLVGGLLKRRLYAAARDRL